MKILNTREEQTAKRVKLEIDRLEKERKNELGKIVIEMRDHLIPEVYTVRVNETNQIYDAKIKELQDELRVIYNDIRVKEN